MLNYYLAPWKKFAQFDGRSQRSEYWWFILGNVIIQYGIIGAGLALGIPQLSYAATIFSFIALIPNLSVTIRRMHDVGKSGWYCLIPFYNLYLACKDSEPGTNMYGPNPKTNELDMSDHLIT